jgi:hypothetical protein
MVGQLISDEVENMSKEVAVVTCMKIMSRVWVTWLIIVGSGSDESIYWIFTGRNYK